MNLLLFRELIKLIKKLFKTFGILPNSPVPTSQQITAFNCTADSTTKCFIEYAGLSSILALGLNFYGTRILKQNNTDERQRLFQLTQMYHFSHSICLLTLPFVPRPKITGSLFSSGILLFCGPIYYHVIKNDNRFRYLTPYGAILLLSGWLSIVLIS